MSDANLSAQASGSMKAAQVQRFADNYAVQMSSSPRHTEMKHHDRDSGEFTSSRPPSRPGRDASSAIVAGDTEVSDDAVRVAAAVAAARSSARERSSDTGDRSECNRPRRSAELQCFDEVDTPGAPVHGFGPQSFSDRNAKFQRAGKAVMSTISHSRQILSLVSSLRECSGTEEVPHLDEAGFTMCDMSWLVNMNSLPLDDDIAPSDPLLHRLDFPAEARSANSESCVGLCPMPSAGLSAITSRRDPLR